MMVLSSASADERSTVFFWKRGQEHGFLSQWHISSFEDLGSGEAYNSAEQYGSLAIYYTEADRIIIHI